MANSDYKIIPKHRVQMIMVVMVFILLIPLFPITGLSTVTGHPWKVELAFALIAFVSIALSPDNFIKTIREWLAKARFVRFAFISLTLFTVWSGFSVFWANAQLSVGHHTSVWILYCFAFLLVIALLSRSSIRHIYFGLGAIAVILLVLIAIDYLLMQNQSLSLGQLRIKYGKYGEMVAMIAPFLASGFFVSRIQATRIASAFAATAAWLVVMLSLSKGALVAGILGFFILFAGILFLSGKMIKKKVVIAAAFLILFTGIFQAGASYTANAPSTAQFISGSSDPTRKSTSFRAFVWRVGVEMTKHNLLYGVGADNFGSSFNTARESYVSGLPVTKSASIAEDHMAERAHNELLQIIAELGIIGITLFLLIALSIAYPLYSEIRRNRRLPIVVIGCVSGMGAFALSSMTSSFSFRAFQNGLVFILLFALAIFILSKRNKTARISRATKLGFPAKIIAAAALGVLALITILQLATGTSHLFEYWGNKEKSFETSEIYFKNSLKLYPENAGALYASGFRAFVEEKPDLAIPRFRKALDYGMTATVVYYYLAKSHAQNGDLVSASKVMAEATRIYPQSVYARVHYAKLLSELSKTFEGEEQMKIAMKIDPKQARTWEIVLQDGLLIATDKARNRKDLALPINIDPKNLIRGIYLEEQVRAARK